jgi:NAD(P)-dependent dehydrogenase (short-subunit alcohol dehydrogenase family)
MDDIVAFITGAGSGIGQAAAKLLARRGAEVALAGRTPDQLAEGADAFGAAGGTALTVTCDVSDEDSVRSAIETTAEAWGRLDVVVANAGVNGHVGRDRRAGRSGIPLHPRYQSGWDLHHHQVRGAASEAPRRLGHRHVLGERHSNFLQFRSDGLLRK